MNEGGKIFALEFAILDEFLHRVQLLVDPRKKMGYLFDSPMRRIVNLVEQWKKGLALPLANFECSQIVINAKRRVEREVVRSWKGNSLQAQARARFRGEEFESKSEDQIEREALRWVNDCWNEAVEHQATI